ncbi:MAG: DNA polymerase III subunit delta [bacterium]|nr:DNA polymerase III subunit delta [Deltaproteobacteria bacterium]MCP4905648.1 DNA polymerase III subunit delta [bacterium]
MNVAAILAELAEGKVRPAYLLAGAEALLRDDALAAIETAVLAGGPRDFNVDRLEVGRVTPGRLEEALDHLPIMAERRLVVLRETEGRGAKLDASWGSVIESWLSRVDATTASVLVLISAKVDKRNKWVKGFRDPAALVECDAPKKTRELAGFLAQEAIRQGIDLESEAAALLVDRIGPQLLMLRQEIEKAALLAGPGETVTRKHVAMVVSAVAEEPIWDLTDAIGQGRVANAVHILSRLLAQGAAPPAILGALASHFRRLLRVGHGESVAGPPFVVRKLETQARRYPARRLVTCLRAIHRADVELKGGSVMRSERALEQLVLGLAS